MDTERLGQRLQDHFQAEVRQAEPSKEWWDEAILLASEPKQRRFWYDILPKTRLAWVMLPVILILIGGAVYGAGSLIQQMFQKYAASVYEDGLAQELNMNQTVDGVTVKLERAYADSNAVLVGFVISGPQDRYYVDFSKITLATADGQSLSPSASFGSVPGSNAILGTWAESEKAAMLVSFDGSPIQGSPSNIDLKLAVQVTGQFVPGQAQTSTGPFNFDFSLTFHAGKVVNIGQTVAVAGIPITLEQAVISPSTTRFVLKFSPPYDDPQKRPAAITFLQTADGEPEIAASEKISEANSIEYFMDNFFNQRGDWTLTINELVFMPESSGQGIETHPASDTKRVSGPWVFHFQVP